MSASKNKVHSAKYKLYAQLTQNYQRAFPVKSKQQVQIDVNAIWAEHKLSDDFEAKILVVISEFKEKASHTSIKKFWSYVPKSTSVIEKVPLKERDDNILDIHKSPNDTSLIEKVRITGGNGSDIVTDDVACALVAENTVVQDKDCPTPAQPKDCPTPAQPKDCPTPAQPKDCPTPAQDLIRQDIDLLNCDLIGLYKRKSVGMLSSDQVKELRDKEKKKNKLQKILNRKIGDQKRGKKFRKLKKEKFEKFLAENPQTSNCLEIRPFRSGRPRIEESQPMLLKTIIDIAMHGSAAHEKRQSDIYRTIKTLDELTSELLKAGFQISRTAVYLRLIPRCSSSIEGKRHIVTCPVKLIRSQNDQHSKHIDGRFCTATIRSLEELASFLGPNETCLISQDDKAKVCIGLTAAKAQAPMLMCLDYKISLPDHNWVVAARHKLIPSVYAGITITPSGFGKTEAVGYSGPTYIAIRSGKHSSSTALSHCLDIEKVIEMPEFENICKHDGIVKPVFIFTVDGGPDENPRYEKVIKVAIHHFVKHNLDALFIATNAPGRSAFNRVERRMAPLSRELSGVILPHDHFGNHLNAKLETVDDQLEKKNFQFAGETLAEIWSQMVIDKYPTKANYILPEDSEAENIISKDVKWTSKHVQTSQYLTQIVKCKDETCCGCIRSSIFKVLNNDTGFIPAPIPLQQTNEGVVAPESSSEENKHFASLFLLNSMKMEDILPSKFKKLATIPYDLYCPSIQKCLQSRTCRICHKYFASLVLLNEHVKYVHKAVTINVPKVRPIRLAAQRANELMAIISNEENEDVEWIHVDDVEDGPQSMLELICKEREMELLSKKIVTVEDHFVSNWENQK